jgi:2-amino-4-hydroxy-6-hydroxymethyldihydropteridine diphosphokinase
MGAMARAYIGLGGNLGDPPSTLRAALRELGSLGALAAVSPAYVTDPIGPPGQPRYLNAVAALDTDLAPYALLERLHAIEARHGRVRAERDGARTLDLDVIAFGDERSDDPALTLPHPRAHMREFVLRPLADVAPDMVLRGRSVGEWLAGLAPQGVERAGIDLTV